MLKSKMIRAGRDINSDLRVQQMRMVQSMGVSESIAFFYPRLFAVSCLAGHVGVVDHHHPAGKVTLPGLVRTSYSRLDPAGVYVLENGQRMFLWVGREVAQEKLLELFGVMTLEDVDATVVSHFHFFFLSFEPLSLKSTEHDQTLTFFSFCLFFIGCI